MGKKRDKANFRVVSLKERNVIFPASWNADVKTGAEAAILLYLAHCVFRRATPSNQPGSPMLRPALGCLPRLLRVKEMNSYLVYASIKLGLH